MRMIDADAFADFIQQTISECNYSKLKLDRCLTVADVLQSVVDELKGKALGGFKNCPTIETTTETVSRQSILDKTHALQAELMSNEDSKWSRNKLAYKYMSYVNGILIREPPVTLGRKRGEWLDVYGEVPIYNAGGFTEIKHIGWKCSACEKQTFFKGDYCPYCGADMREVEK